MAGGLTGLATLSADARQGHLAMLAFSALVAGSFSLGGQVANDIAPAALNALRFVIAMAVVGGVLLLRGGIPKSAARAPWRYLILGALFSTYMVTMFEGLKTAEPVSAAAVFTLTPIMSAGFGFVLLRQRMTPRMALALAIGAVGALWVIFRADLGNALAFQIGTGEAIFFWGCLCHAAYTPGFKLFNRGEPALVFTFYTLVACALLLCLYGWRDIIATDWTALRPLVWITILYVAVAASTFTVLLVQVAAMRLPASKVMAYTYLTPSWVLIWEVALGQPVPPLLVVAGVGLTITALVLLLKE